MKKAVYPLLILIVVFIYFYLRLLFKESVFFDFDMPRVALIAQDFLKNGTFLTSQSFMQESCWLNVPWGPILIFFYAFFLKISSDPLVVADLLTFFHLIGILLMIKIGWKYFSPLVGIISGLLLAANPYWVTYSRIIYQPAPIITFIVISMYLFLSVINDKNKISTIFLPVSWTVLIQMYLPTYSFIFISLLFVIIDFKKISKKYFIVGLALSAILFIPSIKFYVDNPIYINRFIEAPLRFTPPEKTLVERMEKVTLSFIQIPVGGKFEWQTGYGYKDFIGTIPGSIYIQFFLSGFLILALIWNFYFGIIKKQFNRLTIIFWTTCPLWSLVVLWVSDLVPRYFLIAIPPAMLLIAIFINDVLVHFQRYKYIRYLILLIPFLITLYWSIFVIKYDYFISNYSYNSGTLPDVSGSPYKLFKGAMDWVQASANKNGCKGYILSNDLNDLDYNFWMQTKYVWDYIYKNEYIKFDSNSDCIYLLIREPAPEGLNPMDYKRFGPYTVFKYK